MKYSIKAVLTVIILSSASYCFAQKTTMDWENPAVTGRNKRASHANIIPFRKRSKAVEGDWEKSFYYTSLNGKWKFHWSRNPGKRPKSFFASSFDVSSWSEITVPESWQMQGYGTLLYTNSNYPFPKNPPHIPHSYNPVGSYKTSFTIPKNWKDREIILHFGGVSSAMYVWVNGEKVGYSQDSKLPAEFNITPYLKTGENDLSVEVYRWSDGSYLEDQDMWRMSGIQRSVYLYALKDLHISDVAATAGLMNNYKTGQLNASVQVTNSSSKKRQGQVKYRLLDPSDKEVRSGQISYTVPSSDSTTVSFAKQVDDIKPWSAEGPELYSLLVQIDGNNEYVA